MGGSISAAERAYLEAEIPSPGNAWRDVPFCVIDLELTGLDPREDEIVSFGAVTVTGGRVRLNDAVYRVVQPTRMPDPDSVRIHGLRESDLTGAPCLDDVIGDLLEALTGRALVAHVARVETGFLNAILEARGLFLRNPVVDTAALASELQRLRREPPFGPEAGEPAGVTVSSPGLSVLARGLGLPVHRPHTADGDALTTAQAFIALAAHLDAFTQQTLGSLVRISRPKRDLSSPRQVLRRLGLGRADA
jgi:DNA polymerase-3 subunit epsilon